LLSYFYNESPINPKHLQYSPKDIEGKYSIPIANKKGSGLFFNSLTIHANADSKKHTGKIRNCVYVKYILFPENYNREDVKSKRLQYFLLGKNPDPRPYCIDIFGDNFSGSFFPNQDPLKKPLLTPPYNPPITILKENQFLGYGFDEKDYVDALQKIEKYKY